MWLKSVGVRKWSPSAQSSTKTIEHENQWNARFLFSFLVANRIIAEGRSSIAESEVNFLAPIDRMDKLACVALNYSGHCKESNLKPPESPVIFSKFPSNIIGPTDNLVLPTMPAVSREQIKFNFRQNSVCRKTKMPLNLGLKWKIHKPSSGLCNTFRYEFWFFFCFSIERRLGGRARDSYREKVQRS